MRKLWWWIVRGSLMLFLGSVILVLVYSVVPIPLTPLMVLRSVSSLGSDKLVGIRYDWVPLDEISLSMQKAVIKAEDANFFDHAGFDLEAIQKALRYNRRHKRIKGASTITQQTAKNVFLIPQRSWVRKGLEAYFTVMIETFWTKERILEVYLNVIETGEGVYGVEAAAQKYFKTSASKLNSPQASLIAAVLPNPRRFKIDRPSSYVMKRQSRILRRPGPVIRQD